MAIESCMDRFYNPSAIYQQAKEVGSMIYQCRSQIAKTFSAEPSEIYFTSGGSESNNWALRSLAKMCALAGKKHIVSTKFEHPSVMKVLLDLEREGFSLSLVPPDSNGRINAMQLANEIKEDTGFVSVMMVNNEVGTIQPVEQIGKICHERGVLFHTDAVQAVGHIPIDVVRQNIDVMSASAHKFGGLKGTGFLYCSKAIGLAPMILGGGQELGMRAGTENLIGIAAMDAALIQSYSGVLRKNAITFAVRECMKNILRQIPDTLINADTIETVPSFLNVSFKWINGEALALMLAGSGILVSTTSACSVGSGKSKTLEAMGVPDDYINGSVRITIANDMTMSDAMFVAQTMTEKVNKLRGLNRPQK